MRGLALNFASTHQTESRSFGTRGFSEVGENKQLFIAIVVLRFLFSYQFILFYFQSFGIFSIKVRNNIFSQNSFITCFRN
ncbi:MAG: hypothetical protein CMH15_01860 [Mesonia sp.]|nr:hypothetical protein [Mesonia sp.]MAQ39793.1 hypothetical protein [Mesonia sp.]MBJ98881.1 hypothetical protein [Flavobacteriaceae bacterium]